MLKIGFTRPSGLEKVMQTTARDGAILSFDSKNCITQDDANHHILVMGTTGSGKTASVVLPLLRGQFKAGRCGLIVDIKGNLRGQVRALAQATGREDDIVEFGISPTATPLNLLEGLNKSQVNEVLDTFMSSSCGGNTHNRDFHIKGVQMGVDCFEVLLYLSAQEKSLIPTLEFLAELICDPTSASRMYELFKKNIYNPKNKNQRSLVNQIESNEFHIFHYTKNSIRRRAQPTYFEQLNYALGVIRAALKIFLDIPRMCESFAKAGAPSLKMEPLLLQNKIVLLRFGPDSGEAGANLSRKIIKEYYSAIFNLKVSTAFEHPSFICLDEFQEVALLDGSRFSDSNFISQAREFGVSFIASTQSVSALACRSNSSANVDSFVSNCNTKVVFYTDDPRTQTLVSRYDNFDLCDLIANHAFVMQYLSDRREHKQSMESLNDSYQAIKEILEIHMVKESVPSINNEESSVLMDFLSQTTNIERAKSGEGTTSREIEKRKASRHKQLSLKELQSADSQLGELQSADLQSGESQPEELQPEESQPSDVLYEMFSHLFSDNAKKTLNIPAGWLIFSINAFKAFDSSGLKIIIQKIYLDYGALTVSVDINENSEDLNDEMKIACSLLNTLLRELKTICSLCGNKTNNCISSRHREIPVCTDCLIKYSLLAAQEDLKNEESDDSLEIESFF